MSMGATLMMKRLYEPKRYKSISKQINSFLLEQNPGKIITSVIEDVDKVLFVARSFYEDMEKALSLPLKDWFKFFGYLLEDLEHPEVRKGLKKILGFLYELVPSEEGMEEAEEASKGFFGKFASVFKKWIKKFGGSVREKLGRFYESAAAFVRTNPFFAVAILCLVFLLFLGVLIYKNEFDFDKMFNSFANALHKVWESVKSSWHEGSFSSRVLAILKIVAFPMTVVVETFSSNEYDIYARVLSLGSLFFVMLLLGFVYLKVRKGEG